MASNTSLSANGVVYHFDKAPLSAYAEYHVWVISITLIDDSVLIAKRVATSTYDDAEKVAEQWLGDLLRRNPGNLLGYSIGKPQGYNC